MKHAYLALALAAFSCAAIAAPAGTPDAPPVKTDTAAAAAPAGKVKCTRERVTGSNRSVRLCLTQDQARTLSAEEKADLIRSQHNGMAQDD